MEQSGSASDATRTKVLQVFKYLRQLHAVRNPVPLRLEDQPFRLLLAPIAENPFVHFRSEATERTDARGSLEVGSILQIDRVDVSDPPTPPDAIVDWLSSGWSDVEEEPQFQVLRLIDDVEELFEDVASRTDSYATWLSQWRSWRDTERDAIVARDYFERLYQLYNVLERESEQYDLLIGDGMLTWLRGGEDDIEHPILLKRVELFFNADVPQFLIQDAADATELYEPLLGKISGISPTLITDSRQRLIASELHPLDGSEVATFLQQLVTQLDVDGRFEEQKTEPKRTPTISRTPVLFTRKRTLGYAEAVDSMIKDLEGDAPVPGFLAKLVGHTDATASEPGSESANDMADVNGEAEDILLTKPANAEQLEIARRLGTAGGVVVQGPPGTGKSHTIANIVGHLLASGQRILITSHTAKALEVLRDQIVEPLRPLCVTVLGVDAKSRAEMESSINAMTGRLGSADGSAEIREETRLANERGVVLEQLKTTRKQLLSARQDEYTEISLLGATFSPTEAAKYSFENASADGWIPGPLARGSLMPLQSTEVSELYALSKTLSEGDVRLLNLIRPATSELPTVGNFAALVGELESLRSADLEDHFWNSNPSVHSSHLLAAIDALREAMSAVDSLDTWELAAVHAGTLGSGYAATWNRLIEHTRASAKFAAESAESTQKYKPEIAGGDEQKIVPQLRAMEAYIRSGKRIGQLTLLIHRDWKLALERCSVRGKLPASPEEFASLIFSAEMTERRVSLREHWKELLGAHVFDVDADAEPERAAEQYLPRIERLLSWNAMTFTSVIDSLIECGLQWQDLSASLPPNTAKYGELLRIKNGMVERLLPDALAHYRRKRIAEIEADLVAADNRLTSVKPTLGFTPHWQEGSSFIKARDTSGYREMYDDLCRLDQLDGNFSRRKELLVRLREAAPNWAKAIEDLEAPHDAVRPPGDPQRAWFWTQIEQELSTRAAVSIPELQGRIEQLGIRFRDLTAALAERRAWARLLSRTTPAEKSALQMYKNAVKQFGGGKGKRAARFARLAQQQMRLSQDAVPVWVMPLSRAYQTYHHAHVFDVVIIDEASQADIFALLAMAYAKTVIVVGDDEQVTPERPGQEIARVDQLIDALLTGVPGKDLFIEESSIFDFAKVAFGTPVALSEHFRCVEPIIRFSNNLSYNGSIKPLRDASEVIRKPATVAERVDGGESVEQLNIEEARVAASLICAMIEQPEYDDASMGVIALNGPKQGLAIETILRQKLEPREIEARRIRCGMPPQFQGDERDVMVLSVVDSPDEDGSSRDPGYGPRDRTKKRYNVAASRSKDQLWVCHSLNPHLLKPTDLRRRLILHAENPDSTEVRKSEAATRAESVFELRVQAVLIDAGYHVIPQYVVGSYRIDMLVTDGERTLAVECDGDRYHTLETLEADVSRQMILERCKYRFERIRGTEFFRHPELTMRRVLTRIEELGIKPALVNPMPESDGSGLRDRVSSRAREIREIWKTEPEIGLGVKKARQGRLGWGRRSTKAKSASDLDPIAAGALAEAAAEVPPRAELVRPETRQPDIVQSSATEMATRSRGLVERLERESLEVIDNRANKGALWIVGEYDLAPHFEKLHAEGVKFVFAKRGGKATKFRPGWFTTSDG